MSPFIQSPLGMSARSSLPCWQSTFFLSRTGLCNCQCCESSNEVYSLTGGHHPCLGYTLLSPFRCLLQTFLLIFFFFFFFLIVSIFNMTKTLALLVHPGLFWCFHSPLNCDTDYRIFNVCMWSFCMRIHTGDHSLSSHSKDFCKVCTESDSRKISGWTQSLEHNGHPST